MQKRNIFSRIKEQMARSIYVSIMIYVITWPSLRMHIPFCALISFVDIEVPTSDTSRSYLRAVVRIPYDMQAKRVLANVIELSPLDRISPEMKEKMGNLSFRSKYSEITFPILSQTQLLKKDVHFLKYHIYVGGNIGKGQIYLDGSKSNNTIYNATSAGIISKIWSILYPRGPELLVSEGESIKLDRPLTSNPSVGGFGGDPEIVLQDPSRVQGLLFNVLFLLSCSNVIVRSFSPGLSEPVNLILHSNFLKL
ncbi:hypothetical protein MKW92_027829 [Papaver armeniacum]|nr:hypothetical protein MKW92_027829 [Papaver armeniacum]